MHRLHCVKIHPDGMGSAIVLGGLRRQSISTGSEIRAEATSGSIFATHTALVAQKPVDTFETLHVGQALAAIGLTGLLIRGATNPGFLAYFAKQDGQGLLAGSVHRAHQIKNGLLIPERLSVDHQGDVALGLKLIASWDGTNNPILIADNVALPTQTTLEERFSLGPLTILGEVFTGQRNFELNYGNNAESVGSDSDVWDTRTRLVDVMPKATITGIDLEWISDTNIPLTSACATHLTCQQVLRKRVKCGGTWVDAAEDEHIVLSMAGLIHAEELVDASGNGLGICTINITMAYDGTNSPVVVSTGSDY